MQQSEMSGMYEGATETDVDESAAQSAESAASQEQANNVGHPQGWDNTPDGMGQMGLPLNNGPVGKTNQYKITSSNLIELLSFLAAYFTFCYQLTLSAVYNLNTRLCRLHRQLSSILLIQSL